MPSAFISATNATRYSISFPNDTPINSVIFNFTAYVDESVFTGALLGIFLTISQTEQIQSLFRFDSGSRVKDYAGPTLTSLPRIGTVIVVQESVFLRAPVPGVLFGDNDQAEFEFNLNTVTFGNIGSGGIVPDLDTIVSVTVTRPPGEL